MGRKRRWFCSFLQLLMLQNTIAPCITLPSLWVSYLLRWLEWSCLLIPIPNRISNLVRSFLNQTPTIAASEHISHTSRPISHMGEPISRTSRPISRVSEPISHHKMLISRRGRPISRMDELISHTSRSISRLGESISRAIKCISRPISKGMTD